MKNLSGIQLILRTHAVELRERYGITSLAVFESVARGEAKDESDVDLPYGYDREHCAS
jgi:hypothetical protein